MEYTSCVVEAACVHRPRRLCGGSDAGESVRAVRIPGSTVTVGAGRLPAGFCLLGRPGL